MHGYPGPYLGAAYYPEDWPLSQIDADIALMKDAGMQVMRVGEFAWSRMEPREGQYDFRWLRMAVDKLAAADMAVIMCTPTCTPPAWLSERYPEILLVTERGDRAQHGARRHACPTSPVYRAFCDRIVTRMAQEFGNDVNIIGWQIDNELYPHDRGCCCPVCHRAFQEAMRRQFESIEALNAAWGTDLWSQTYTSFAQLPVPRRGTWHHPSLITAWLVFQSDAYVAFTEAQAAILHRLTRHPIGTDMMPFGGLNYQRIHRDLDVAQFNHYPQTDTLWQSAFWMDLLRPLKPRPFWNTETACCWNGSTASGGYKEPGFCRAVSWLPVALGGEANLYWLWRAHWSGQELMHGAVVSSCGRPLHMIDEVRDIARGFRATSDFLRGSPVQPSGLALHFSGLAWSLFESQPLIHGFDYKQRLLNDVYRPLLEHHWRPDVIDPAASLADYRVIGSPFLPSLEEAGLAGRLKAWIEAGGTWIAGPLTDIRTRHATKYIHAPFGVIEDWAGVRCRYQIPQTPHPFKLRWRNGGVGAGALWYDGFDVEDGTEVLAVYTHGPLKGLAAAVRRRMGKGAVIILGTVPDADALARLVAAESRSAGIAPAAVASANVLAVPREGAAGRGLVVIELQNRTGKVTLDRPMTDILTGVVHRGSMPVAPYQVMVLRAAEQPATRRGDTARGTRKKPAAKRRVA